ANKMRERTTCRRRARRRPRAESPLLAQNTSILLPTAQFLFFSLYSTCQFVEQSSIVLRHRLNQKRDRKGGVTRGFEPLLDIGGQRRAQKFVLSLGWPITKCTIPVIKNAIEEPFLVQTIQRSHDRGVGGVQTVFHQQLAHGRVSSIPKNLQKKRLQR